MTTHWRIWQALALLLMAALMGCGTTTVKSTQYTPLSQETAVIPDAELLDVGVVPFDPGVDGRHDDDVRPEVRNAESRYLASQLVATLQSSAAWGPVRVIPDP
ncbi:MAG: hypothetical protein M0R02_16625, partial [Bacteroidales bacterium]|nr:hypothetical protein [Bacteroidales bacterium]